MKTKSEPDYVHQSAIFDDQRVYRYLLTRVWEPERGRLPFLLLNPSTADENVLDPTLRRCLGFAKRLGFGGFEILNLFALRSTDPKALYSHHDPIGPANNEVIRNAAQQCQLVIAGWGVHGMLHNRASAVKGIVRGAGAQLMCLGKTKDGHPRHPLYLPSDMQLIPC